MFTQNFKKKYSSTPLDLTRYFVRRSKYNSRKVVVDGIVFHSIAESERYKELKLLEAAGEIVDLKTQFRFRCVVNGYKICDYYADFKYFDMRNKKFVVEDKKGYKTDEYKIKKKLVEAIFSIQIVET